VELRNRYGPLIEEISSDGRFLVTLDEWTSSGTGPLTVVIYDLARKEHTAYAGKEFLSEEVRKSLSHQGFIKGFKWFGKDCVLVACRCFCKSHDWPFGGL
jgi:hypothetical protein